MALRLWFPSDDDVIVAVPIPPFVDEEYWIQSLHILGGRWSGFGEGGGGAVGVAAAVVPLRTLMGVGL